MKQKIEWYKEVLELEPGSKVFFPLARMQAEDGQPDAALSTLRHGLARNPEHLEARLLLIDILSGRKEYDGIWPEVDAVAQMLGGYPGFWAAWTERMSKNPQSRDAALALSFLSQSLKGHPISWSDVIEHGLNQLLSPGSPVAVKAPQAAVSFDMAEMSALAEGFSAAPKTPEKPVAPAPSAEPKAAGTPDADEEEEPFSLKTRSMAEVLAEQGDYVGALDIYEELLKQARTEEEKISLEDAIARLSADVSAVPASDNGVASSGDKSPAQEKQGKGQDKGRLLDVLELLADRLESKAE